MAANFVISTKMMAWVYSEHGDVANVLRLDPEFEVPGVQEGQVLVKVLAAALNLIDTGRVTGVYQLPGFSLSAGFGPTAQLGKEVFGAARVAATCSTGKLDLLKSLGADLAIDYTKVNFEDLPEKFDVVYVAIGQSERAVKAVKPRGSVVRIVEHNKTLPPPAFSFIGTSDGSTLEKLKPFLESRKMSPVIDPKSPFPFTQAIEAFISSNRSGSWKSRDPPQPVNHKRERNRACTWIRLNRESLIRS